MDCQKYKLYIPGIDFEVRKGKKPGIGTKTKFFAILNDGRQALYKPNLRKSSSEECSEKISYELAKMLNIPAAQIELTKDKEGDYGLLSVDFTAKGKGITHTDAAQYLNLSKNETDDRRKEKYNIEHILDKLISFGNEVLLAQFVQLMIFDALVGEADRHEENWGILNDNGIISLSPIYDTAASCLPDFKNASRINQFISSAPGRMPKNFLNYILKSKTRIYNQETGLIFKHFELIDYISRRYPKETSNALEVLRSLKVSKIENAVEQIPNEIITATHKQFIIIYLRIRRNILLGEDNDKNLVADLEKLQKISL